MSLLELMEVTKRYGSEVALDGVTFSMEGGTIGLLGPNGAGKSTLIKVLLGLVDFDGQALLFGLDPRNAPTEVRARIGYMAEGESTLAGLTAVDMCAFAAELSGLPRTEAIDRAHKALGYVGLGDKRYQKVEGYSAGQKQKVKLAQAIVHDPDLLLLDEPTSALDPRGRDEMLHLIADIPKKRGSMLILSSHLLPDIESVCNQVIVLSRGELRFAGSMAELRAGELGQYQVRIKGEVEPFERALAVRGCRVAHGEDGALSVTLPPGGDTQAILRASVESGVQVRQLEPERRTLEDAFLETVGADDERRAREFEAWSEAQPKRLAEPRPERGDQRE